MTDSEHNLSTATIHWDENGQPLSSAFDDVYFSKASGLNETRYVFLQHNDLAERWQQLGHQVTNQEQASHQEQAPNQAPVFTIAETGFGTGLNFLCTWQLWEQTAPANAQLHFISVEKFPLSQGDLAKSLALWPELQTEAEALQAAYPPPVAGIHRRQFLNGRIQLTLIYGDAKEFTELLPSLSPQWDEYRAKTAKVDAWFLDGFAPSKNPQMWSDELFATISRLSMPGTTAATFTCAGIVKRGLNAAGFELKKVPGFGRKREMLTAKMKEPDQHVTESSEDASSAGITKQETPWYVPQKALITKNRTATVIGGGIAGATIANALAKRGWKVKILEQQNSLGQEGSGNPQGLLYAKLSHKVSDQSQFNLISLLFAQQFYRSFWKSNPNGGKACGVVQLSQNEGHQQLQQLIADQFSNIENEESWIQYLNSESVSKIAGIPLRQGGLWFPSSGWLKPAAVCEWLCTHANIDVHTNTAVNNLESTPLGWKISATTAATDNATNEFQSDIVVIANAFSAKQFIPWLPVKPIRGQVSYLPATDTSKQLQCALCSEGYIAPTEGEQHCIGASFHPNEDDTSLTVADHQHNLSLLSEISPRLSANPQAKPEQLEGRAALRCASADYLPLCGPIPNTESFDRDYANLRRNRKTPILTPGEYQNGLYLFNGLGSRGLTYAPLCADYLAGEINGELPALSRNLRKAINPARFLIRDLARNKR